ncbi:hypothetical protein P1S61_39460 [Streptomyces sp. ME08-AFT2]|uniref:hypothetical protein n=1 Tax=Streptomyces sp. ME08-AFT2 TaxID=3028683 RepID=UPI0029B66A69|nr:hypothetical protein [Streptomyces sp. ME08-AFT2]MDX3315033.1 hypothetical protein [Streptomyces sp. ME08-AFT2]
MTPLSMPFRALAALLLSSAVIATAACSADPNDDKAPGARGASPSSSAANRQRPVLAFVRPKQQAVMVADAAGRTWQADRTEGQVPDRLSWSPDGRRLIWTDPQKEDTTGRLHVLDVTTGKKVSHACPCSGAGFLGEEAVGLASDGSALLVFPATGNPRRIALNRSKGPYASLVTGGAEDVTLFTPLPEGPGVFRGQGTLDAVDRQGRVRPLLPAKQPSTLTQAWRAPDGKGVAWGSADSGGACWTVSTLFQHSGAAGRPTRLLPGDTAFRQALIGDQRLILSAAWAGAGLTVTYTGIENCQARYPGRSVTYYVRDGKWTYLGSGLLGLALGADGRVARLRGDAHVADGMSLPVGALSLTSGAREQVLADGVSAFVFTPAESAAAGAPAARPQPPAAAVTSVDDHGKALPETMVRLARRIERAAADDDTEALVRLCTGCREGVLQWVRRTEAPSEILQAIRAHPLVNGPQGFMYPGLTMCVDEPQQDITCTPEQLHDIAVLGLKPDRDGDYGGSVYSAWKSVSVPLIMRMENGGARWTGLAAG